jgi:serine/threonine-protein kinase
MLSPSPEARGTARELAEALEQAAREAGPEADVPLFIRQLSAPMKVRATTPHPVPRRAPGRSGRPWLTAASLGGALALGAAWILSAPTGEQAARTQSSAPEETEDGGTVAVGDAVLTAPVPATRTPSAWFPIAVDLPPKPLPGQRRPDANGRCPIEPQVVINGGCWIKLPVKPKDCQEVGYTYKGECYVPSFPPARPPTSSPAERVDDSP